MSKENVEEISILTFEIRKEDEAFTMFPSPSRIVVRSNQVLVEKFGENLSDFVKMLGKVVDALPDSCKGYDVDTLTFSLSVDGSGKISLIGELSAGFTSGITITLKKQKKVS